MNQAGKSVAVFCASAEGANPAYRAAAEELGRAMAARGIGLIYGGATVGLMGAVADAALAAGGHVVGVIPHVLVDLEVSHKGISELHVVDTMHTRKALMAEKANAFMALPGGFGTFEELFEVITWSNLGLHDKPVGLLNTDGYFDPLLAMLSHAVSERFVRPEHPDPLVVSDRPDTLASDLLRHPRLASRPRWINPDQT